ncbi:MAG: peptidoglycan editing factor PgeF [Endomicrobium sp.]|nr:peptidoglycan editing factor PgeF [Endomicrobium sp.]
MKKIISNNNFPYKHFTTTKSAGNMKDNFQRVKFMLSLNLDPTDLVLANQIHSNNIKIVNASDRNTFINDCDGLITQDKNTILGIFSADCVPLLISDGRVKAAIHAGWKGLYFEIIENTINILKNKFCVKTEKISIYIGPHIRPCCYKVSNEMENIFNFKLKNNKLNLSEIIYNKLKKLKVNKIFNINQCTFHKTNLFFSYRFNKCSERMLSIIQ